MHTIFYFTMISRERERKGQIANKVYYNRAIYHYSLNYVFIHED